MRYSVVFTRLALLAPLVALLAGLAAQAQDVVEEDRDFGVTPSTELQIENHASPTPLEIPRGITLRTVELRRMMQAPVEAQPLLFDVLGGDGHETLPGAIWIPGAGRGTSFDDGLQAHLANFLQFATRGNKAKTMVFYCTGPRCWLSYNAALRAMRLGYTDVRWYRGGIQAWGASGGMLVEPRVKWKQPPLLEG